MSHWHQGVGGNSAVARSQGLVPPRTSSDLRLMALSALVHDVSSQDEFRAALYAAAFMIHFLLQEQQSRAGRRGDALRDRLFPAPLFEHIRVATVEVFAVLIQVYGSR